MTEIDREIIMASLTGEASTEQLAALRAWRESDPANEREYRSLVRLWEVAGEVGSRMEDRRPRPGSDAIIDIAERRTSEDSYLSLSTATTQPAEAPAAPEPSRRSAVGTGRAAAVAAALVVGLGAGALLWGGPAEVAFGPRTLTTGQNEVATVTLADETVVRLAPESRLQFRGEGESREVTLAGRAYFAVSPRPDDPFLVRLPGGTIEVLGTRFDVEGRNSDMQVAVVEGEVRVQSEGGEVNVQADQVARVRERALAEVEQVTDVYQHLGWLGRFLAFESTPMDEVAEEFQRRFGIDIQIADAELLDRTVTGWFADQSPDAMVGAVCAVVDARCSTIDGTVWMEVNDGRPTRAGRRENEAMPARDTL